MQSGRLTYYPAIIRMRSGEKQLWRVVNASADTQLDLQLLFDGVPQILQIVALDGVPIDSQDGTRRGRNIKTTDKGYIWGAELAVNYKIQNFRAYGNLTLGRNQ